jgi:hypothetical protein
MSTATTTVTWKIAQLERETTDGYVFTAHYTVDANDGTYSAGAYGSLGLERPEGEMVPFADLTEEIVIGWVKDKLGGEEKVAEIEAALQAQLDEQHAPSKAAGLPWAMQQQGQVRARDELGQYVADDPTTPENEAWTEPSA